jgi:hypothetical protein
MGRCAMVVAEQAALADVPLADDATWARARGQALSQAAIFIPYYLHTNPVGVSNARHMLDEVLGIAR